MYEQSNSEIGRGKTCNTTRQSIYKNIAGKIDADIRKEEVKERKHKQIIEQGNGKYIMDGSNDRVNGILYQGIREINSKYETPEDERSYYYGYVTHGGKRLEGVIYTLEKEGKYDEIAAIGYRDYELGMTEEEIGLVEGQKPTGLAKYESYMEGYNAAKSSSKARK